MVGAVPLFVDTLGWGPISLRMMRSVGSDYAGARSYWCVKEEFLPQFAEAVHSDFCESGCDLLYIGEWPGYFQAAPSVANEFRKLTGEVNVVHAANYYPQAVFDLAGDVDAYLATLSPSEKQYP
ncbi:MAG: hypothetical protein HY287_08745 [Planctomycetes bacterium]|nr:hypothetical protein [Planctomycetota bacterium]MBI3834401.1 hypothetical protein [Planctomycetota bacterium]